MSNPAYQIILNIILLLVGWVVVHRLSVKREKDKEKRQLGEKIIGIVEELELTAKAYHTRSGRLEVDEEKIWSSLAKIERGLQRMHLARNIQDNMHIIRLRMAITYKNFGNDPFEKQSEDSKLIANITIAAEEMISFIDDSVIRIS